MAPEALGKVQSIKPKKITRTKATVRTVHNEQGDTRPRTTSMPTEESLTHSTHATMLKCLKKRAVTGFLPPPGGPHAHTNTTSMICRNCNALRSYLRPSGCKKQSQVFEQRGGGERRAKRCDGKNFHDSSSFLSRNMLVTKCTHNSFCHKYRFGFEELFQNRTTLNHSC